MYLGFWKRVLINGIFFIAIAGLYSSGLHVANVWVAFMAAFRPVRAAAGKNAWRPSAAGAAAAFVLGLLNTFVKPFLIILSLPITLWTMGLFYFVINALLLELTSVVMKGAFYFTSFGSALIVAIIMSIVNLIVTNYFMNR